MISGRVLEPDVVLRSGHQEERPKTYHAELHAAGNKEEFSSYTTLEGGGRDLSCLSGTVFDLS